MDSPLRGKRVYCREWVMQKLNHILDAPTPDNSLRRHTMVVGCAGAGKTAVLTETCWPTCSNSRQSAFTGRVLSKHFCQAHCFDSMSIVGFIVNIISQLKNSVIADRYSEELSEAGFLASTKNIEKNPDEAFRAAVLRPLKSIECPNMFFVIDSIDEDYEGQVVAGDRSPGSRTIAELLASNLGDFPEWLYLLVSSRRKSKKVTKHFAGFRKITLDDTKRDYIVKDAEGYIFNRCELEDHLSSYISPDTVEMLEILRIKSSGCFLYIEWVLNCIISGVIKLREIKEIPGTLNGLYLWLCQRIFEGKSFRNVRPILNVLVSARTSLTETDLIDCLWSRNLPIPQEELLERIHSLEKFLHRLPDGSLRIFHHSFSEWLLDVKHCTQKFLCDSSEGYATLALSATCNLSNESFDELSTYIFAFDLSRASLMPPLNHELLALWMLWSGANVENSFDSGLVPRDPDVLKILIAGGAYLENLDAEMSDRITLTTSLDVDSDCNRGGGGGSDTENAIQRMLRENPASIDNKHSNGRTFLCNVAHLGSLGGVSLLVNAGADVNSVDKQQQSALILASRQGHAGIVEVLLGAGAEINHRDVDGWSALRASAWGGHTAVVSVLLSHGAEVDLSDNDERTALRAAAWSGHYEIVKMLVEAGAEVDREDSEGRTALTAAAFMGHCDIVSLLVEQGGADVDHADADRRTPLLIACTVPRHNTHMQLVNLLLHFNATVDFRDKDGMSPLFVAATEGHSEVCELLLESGAKVDLVDGGSTTPLQSAVRMGHQACVDTLIQWGAALDAVDRETGRCLLSLAALQGSTGIVHTLITHSLDECHRDDNGCTPLHLAAAEGHVEVCELLLQTECSVDEEDSEGATPLIHAAREGHIAVLELLLLAHGAEIHHTTLNGQSPVRLAAQAGNTQAVHFLMGHGADIEDRDVEGRTTLYALAQENQLEMTRFALENGASVNSVDVDQRTALMVAAWQGYPDLCALLLSHGADVHLSDKDGLTCLLMAAWQGHAEVVGLLLEHGADIEHACRQDATALCIAAQEGHLDTVKVLLTNGANPYSEDKFGRNAVNIALKHNHSELISVIEDLSGITLDRTQGLASPSKGGSSRKPSLPAPRPKQQQQQQVPPPPRNSKLISTLNSTMKSEHRRSAHSMSSGHGRANGGSASSSANSSLDKRSTHSQNEPGNHYDEPCSLEHTQSFSFTQALKESSLQRKRTSIIYDQPNAGEHTADDGRPLSNQAPDHPANRNYMHFEQSILDQAWKNEQIVRDRQRVKKMRRLSVFGKLSNFFKFSSSSAKFKHPLFQDLPHSFDSLNITETLNIPSSTASKDTSPRLSLQSNIEQNIELMQYRQAHTSADNIVGGHVSGKNYFDPFSPVSHHPSQSNSNYHPVKPTSGNPRGNYHPVGPAAAQLAPTTVQSRKSDYMRLVDLSHLQSVDPTQRSFRNYDRLGALRAKALENSRAVEGSHNSPVAPCKPMYVATPELPFPSRPPPPVPQGQGPSYFTPHSAKPPPPPPRRPRHNSHLFTHTGGFSKIVHSSVSAATAAAAPQAEGGKPSTSGHRNNYMNHGEAVRKAAALCKKPNLETIVEPANSIADSCRSNSSTQRSSKHPSSSKPPSKVETVI